MKIALLGDMALIGRYDTTCDDNVSKRINKIAETVKDCDFVIANLESPFTTKKRTHVCKGVYLKSNPCNVSILKEIGITHVTLANNHTFDYGKKGALETIRTLKENDIEYVGLCNDPILLEKDGERALLDGFCCYSSNGTGYGKKPLHLRPLNEDNFRNFFAKAKDAKAVPIASVHFGIEGVNYPSTEHMRFFRDFAKETDYVLHGNHPHTIQGYEKENNSLLYYACGDLCFDDATETSINSIATQDDYSRLCYISVFSIENGICNHIKLVPLTDLPDGIIRESSEVMDKISEYSHNLTKPSEELESLRKTVRAEVMSSDSKRTLKFYTDRLNYKYVGAYINGMLHAKKYRKLFRKWM